MTSLERSILDAYVCAVPSVNYFHLSSVERRDFVSAGAGNCNAAAAPLVPSAVVADAYYYAYELINAPINNLEVRKKATR